jgi:hypothetical protein
MRAHVITLGLGSMLAVGVAFAGCAQTGVDEDPPPVVKPDASTIKDTGVRDTGTPIKDAGTVLDTGPADTGIVEPVDSGTVVPDSGDSGGSSVPVCSNCGFLNANCELQRQLATAVAACSDCVAGTCCFSSSVALKIYCLTP